MIRSLISLLLSFLLAQAQGLEAGFGTRRLWPFLAARGLTGAASMTLYYEAIARMPLADAVSIHPSNFSLPKMSVSPSSVSAQTRFEVVAARRSAVMSRSHWGSKVSQHWLCAGHDSCPCRPSAKQVQILMGSKDAVQMTIMYSNPVLCAILGWAFRADRVGILGALGIAVTMLGVVFVAQPPVIFGGHEWSRARMTGLFSASYE